MVSSIDIERRIRECMSQELLGISDFEKDRKLVALKKKLK